MAVSPVELPLEFQGHCAKMLATAAGDGSWAVETEVDGRPLGQEHCPDWRRVEQFRARMQNWLRTAEIAEREREATRAA